MDVGYVGLGSMGGALARRLQLTHNLTVYDSDAAAVRRLTDAGARTVTSLTGLASRCDSILLCLPTSDHVRSVIFGPDGLLEGLRPGTIIVDQTSGDPTATREMAVQLLDRGIHLVDAPVSGGVRGAEAGTIAIMVGASEEDYDRIHPLLSAISPNIFHAGGPGNGQVIKLVNNMLSSAQRLLTFEGLALAAKNGVAPRTALEILMSSGGRSAYLEKRGAEVLNGNLVANFTLGLAHKDVRLACQLGVDSGVPLLLGNLTREIYQMCLNERGAQAQVDTAALVFDRLSGTQIIPAEHITEVESS
jgi:3-hydroxyisobutyrate dehydrogenase